MTDTPQIPSQITLTDFGGPSRMLGRTTDESLFLEAITRWEDSRQRLLELTANVPSVHACITQWLKQTLNLDGDSVQVHFFCPGRYARPLHHLGSGQRVCAAVPTPGPVAWSTMPNHWPASSDVLRNTPGRIAPLPQKITGCPTPAQKSLGHLLVRACAWHADVSP